MAYLNPGYLPVNSCSVFTITPMVVKCNVTNVTGKEGSANGSITLQITGGTPPYTIIWSYPNGVDIQGPPTINNLSVGTYSATVRDYYGDFIVTTSCSVGGIPTTTTTTSTTTLPPFDTFSFCMKITACTNKGCRNKFNGVYYFIPNGILNGYPSWISSPDNEEIIYYDSTIPTNGGWNLSGSPMSNITINNYIVFNSNPSYPPLPGINPGFTNWTILNAIEGSVKVTLGTCT